MSHCGLYRDLFDLLDIPDKGQCSSDSSWAQFRLSSSRIIKFERSVVLGPLGCRREESRAESSVPIESSGERSMMGRGKSDGYHGLSIGNGAAANLKSVSHGNECRPNTSQGPLGWRVDRYRSACPQVVPSTSSQTSPILRVTQAIAHPSRYASYPSRYIAQAIHPACLHQFP